MRKPLFCLCALSPAAEAYPRDMLAQGGALKSGCSCRRTKAGRHAGRLLTAEPNICRAGSAVRRDFGVRKRHSVPIPGRCQMLLKRWDSCCTLLRRGLLSLDFSLFGAASVSFLLRAHSRLHVLLQQFPNRSLRSFAESAQPASRAFATASEPKPAAFCRERTVCFRTLQRSAFVRACFAAQFFFCAFGQR